MESSEKNRFLALKVGIGSLVATVVMFAGCSSEVGTVPSGKEAMNNYIASEAEKAAVPNSKNPKKTPPKSIKSKILTKPAEESN